MDSLDTKFSKVVFSNGQFAIFKMKNGESAKGEVLGVTPEQLLDTEINLIGTWEKSKFGNTFKFERYTINEDQVSFFLSKVIGHIASKTAKLISAQYGAEVWNILDSNPEKLLEFKGVGQKKLDKIIKSWNKNKSMLNLARTLSPYGVTNNQIARIHEHFGDNALEIVLKTPYRLVEIRGIGFKLADSIALKLGFAHDDHHRIEACAQYVIEESMGSQGHSAFLPSWVMTNMADMLKEQPTDNISPALYEQGLVDLIDNNEANFVLDQNNVNNLERIRSDDLISLSKSKRQETFIMKALENNRQSKPIVKNIDDWIKSYEKMHNYTFGEEQKEAIMLANNNHNIFAISGYAGTGKTTVSKAILSLVVKVEIDDSDVICMALAGIAANRIKKQSGYPSGTIHSVLGFNGKEYGFGLNNKLPHKVVLLDEASMADDEMMYRVFSAIDFSRTKLILMGDPAQLQPVGAGAPFSDMLHYKLIPNVTLTRIYRTSDDMVINTLAAEVRKGVIPNVNGKYQDFGFHDLSIPGYQQLRSQKTPEEIKAIRDQNNLKIREQVLKIATTAKPDITKLISYQTAWEYITRFQVVAPMRSGTLGIDELNNKLQEVLNPYIGGKQLKAGFAHHRIHDKVVHLKNMDMQVVPIKDYAQWAKDDNEDHLIDIRVMNGQLGITVFADEEEIHVYYPLEGYVCQYTQQEVASGNVAHSFALTVHKTQGSEFHQVVYPLTISHYNMLNPKLFYTAMTRTKERLDIVGQREALSAACKERPGQDRVTCIGAIVEHRLAALRASAAAPRPL